MIYYHRCLPRQTSNCSIDHCSAQARLKITSKHTSTKPSDEKLRLANCCSENLSVLFHPGRSDRIHKSVCDGGISGFNYHLIRCSIADLSQYLLEFCFFLIYVERTRMNMHDHDSTNGFMLLHRSMVEQHVKKRQF